MVGRLGIAPPKEDNGFLIRGAPRKNSKFVEAKSKGLVAGAHPVNELRVMGECYRYELGNGKNLFSPGCK